MNIGEFEREVYIEPIDEPAQAPVVEPPPERRPEPVPA